MAKKTGKITKTKKGKDKEFKGSGVEGLKGAPGNDPEASLDAPADPLVDDAERDGDKPEASEAEQAAKDAAEVKSARLKELKASLKARKAENEKLLEEEDELGFMDGHLMTARKARVIAIEKLEAEIKSLGK